MIISRTPLRISFAGGGSDLPAFYHLSPGAVVSTAIKKYTFITVNKKFDDMIRVSYSKTELVSSVDDLEHNIIREALKIVGVDRGIDLIYMGDIPSRSVGTGLGSSSSLAVGVLNALYAYVGRHVSAEQLAKEACRIEMDILKHPIGRQDQYIAAYGGFRHIVFNCDDSVFAEPLICTKEVYQRLAARLMLFFTGIDRVSSDILTNQQKNTCNHLDELKEMVRLAGLVRDAVIEGDLDEFGSLLHDGWCLKKRLSDEISNSLIDDYYNRARAAGAIGGKIAGAGGGGFLLLYCEPDKQAGVRRALSGLMETPFDFEPQGSKIIYVSD